MPIFEGSRYATGRMMIFVQDDDVRRMVYRKTLLGRENIVDFTLYTTKAGDRFDTLALIFGGDARKWWVIAEVNDFVGFPLDLTPGTELKIPPKSFFDGVG